MQELGAARRAIREAYLVDESTCVRQLLGLAATPATLRACISDQAQRWITQVRANAVHTGGLDVFLQEYDLSSHEGVVLMCLAEALLRIPDAHTADLLIREKLSKGQWSEHLGHSGSAWVNASSWGLLLTGRLIELDRGTTGDIDQFLARLISRTGEPVVRLALKAAMRILGYQFVLGSDITQAVKRGEKIAESKGYLYSYDMLGEAALTQADAQKYLTRYLQAIEHLQQAGPYPDIYTAPSISIKLSALHPRYEYRQRERVLHELVPVLHQLIDTASVANISITLDAEEADRLELSLDIIEALMRDLRGNPWQGFGMAVQAYQKRALPLLRWLGLLAKHCERRIAVRLVKGAYWDTEIKRAQQAGLSSYPVFTQKVNTDLSYRVCAQELLAHPEYFYAQFATHNAYTAADMLARTGPNQVCEFQRLHGMGEALYDAVLDDTRLACRTYAPVGDYHELLPYLVRRLLENGANTSFVHRITDPAVDVAWLTRDPEHVLANHTDYAHPQIVLPREIFGPSRTNSHGINLDDIELQTDLLKQVEHFVQQGWIAAPLLDGATSSQQSVPRFNPANSQCQIGQVTMADDLGIEHALRSAQQFSAEWRNSDVELRVQALLSAANLFEEQRAELVSLCIAEGGRSLSDSLAEVREAVDFCRYYASCLHQQWERGVELPGPTGETNQLWLRGRGVLLCISPWNFPLAIFVGQVSAALAAGNVVLAKPASHTPLIAHLAVQIFYRAGIPAQALYFLPVEGARVGRLLIDDARVEGVLFTGSTQIAQQINRKLAARPGSIVPLIAETGGINAMIVDSSALAEQVVADVMDSAFNSAGQRCSALRILFVQREAAPRIFALLKGAMLERVVGDPARLATDIGPLISSAAQQELLAYVDSMRSQAIQVTGATLREPGHEAGWYLAPQVIELDDLGAVTKEVFGPILHVVQYSAHKIDQVIAAINATGYGLTLGIASRVEQFAAHIIRNARVGNVYVNRNQIGAVVGVQPFGGQGLSGTGPKAGGPHYLPSLGVEQSCSTNTTAIGGNPNLLALQDQEPT